MKKNSRIVIMAAAALLAVAPVAAGVVPGANVNTTVQAGKNDSKAKETAKQVITVIHKDGKKLTKDKDSNSYSSTLNLNSNENSVSAITKKIIDDYQFKIGNDKHPLNTGLVETSVRSALLSANITVDAQGNFTSPAVSFPLNVSITWGDATAATLNLTVTPYDASSDTSKNPIITYNNKQYKSSQTLDSSVLNNAAFTKIALNGTVDTAAIQRAFTATVAGGNMPLTVTVDTSKVNTAIGGTYPVTASATDANNKRTVTLTFNVQVGVAGAKYQTATSANNADIPVYSIYGNAVSTTTTTIKSGTSVPTFGTVTIGNTSYTRINSANSHEFVLTSVFNATPSTPAQDTDTATHTVMVDSKAYDKNGNYLGHMYYAYNDISIVPKVVTINGKTYYKVANKDEYVRVTNITGTQRRLRHNAYIYWSSYRRTPGTGKMYRGETVTTYGGQMRFKNGKKYYRIEGCRYNNKRYIKAVNFYPLG